MWKEKKSGYYRNIEITLTSLALLIIMESVVKYIDNTRALYVICPLLIVLNSLRYWFYAQVKRIFQFIIRWRWVIAGVIFIVLVALGIHGSSMASFNILCPSDKSASTGILFGEARAIRSDEYAVQVPYFFSQHYNHYREYSYQMSISGQDMIIGYNSPVIDFTLIGKPFVLGYLLLGNARGLSWYWCSKVILALLVAFEMLRILTRNDEISLFGAILIVLSPAMQWWFAPHMYDVFFWSMAIFDAGYYFFTMKRPVSKLFTCVLLVSTLTGFVVALFPSLQVACGLCVLALLIACLIRDRKMISFRVGDFARLAVVLVVVGVILGHWILTAKGAIEILSNTAYPGKRISVGGDSGLSALFTNINSLFTQFYTPAVLNQCEVSSFIHLGLLCALLYPYLWWKKRGDRSLVVGGSFFIILLVQIEFMLVGFPEWLAKATLFSYINRMGLAYGFASALFTCWTMAYVFNHENILRHWYPALSLVVFACLYYIGCRGMYDSALAQTRIGYHIYTLVVIIFSVIGLFLILGWKRYMVSFLTVMTIFSGMFVNPVCSGIDPITDHDYIRAAEKMNAEDEGNWITVGTFFEQELLLANGLKTLNAVNYYPDFGKWRAVDTDGTYLSQYNRYAHISIFMNENDTTVSCPVADQTVVNLNVHDVKKFGAKYILASSSYSQLLKKYSDLFEECYNSKGYEIYKVKQ